MSWHTLLKQNRAWWRGETEEHPLMESLGYCTREDIAKDPVERELLMKLNQHMVTHSSQDGTSADISDFGRIIKEGHISYRDKSFSKCVGRRYYEFQRVYLRLVTDEKMALKLLSKLIHSPDIGVEVVTCDGDVLSNKLFDEQPDMINMTILHVPDCNKIIRCTNLFKHDEGRTEIEHFLDNEDVDFDGLASVSLFYKYWGQGWFHTYNLPPRFEQSKVDFSFKYLLETILHAIEK